MQRKSKDAYQDGNLIPIHDLNNKKHQLRNDKLYFTELLKEIKTLYKLNKFKTISVQKIDNLKYAYSLVVLNYFKTQLSGKSNGVTGKSGTVIDITGS